MTPYDFVLGILTFRTFYRIIPNPDREYSWEPKWIVKKWIWYLPFFRKIHGNSSKQNCEEFLIEYTEGMNYFSEIYKE